MTKDEFLLSGNDWVDPSNPTLSGLLNLAFESEHHIFLSMVIHGRFLGDLDKDIAYIRDSNHLIYHAGLKKFFSDPHYTITSLKDRKNLKGHRYASLRKLLTTRQKLMEQRQVFSHAPVSKSEYLSFKDTHLEKFTDLWRECYGDEGVDESSGGNNYLAHYNLCCAVYFRLKLYPVAIVSQCVAASEMIRENFERLFIEGLKLDVQRPASYYSFDGHTFCELGREPTTCS